MIPKKHVKPGSKLYLDPVTNKITHQKTSLDFSETVILVNPLEKDITTYMEDDRTLLGKQKWEVVINGVEVVDRVIHFSIGDFDYYHKRYAAEQDKPEKEKDLPEDKFVEVTIDGKKIEVY